MELLDYIRDAKLKNNLKSDRALDRALSNLGASVCTWRSGRSLPSETAMAKLAELAGCDPELAVMELHEWTAAEPVKSIYQEIIKKLQLAAAASIFGLFLLFPTIAEAATVTAMGTDSVQITKALAAIYIMRF